jgi:D-serine deaminase-like pyridoxal phosphate-dependent protein
VRPASVAASATSRRRRVAEAVEAADLRLAGAEGFEGLLPGDPAVREYLAFVPCTTFDKWRVIYVVDDAYRVTDVLRTYF